MDFDNGTDSYTRNTPLAHHGLAELSSEMQNERGGDLGRLQRENAHLKRELHDLKHSLEEQVRERNAQLQTSNELLREEREQLKRTVDALSQAQTKLTQSERVASIGMLTSGVAHEINNPLAFLIPNFSFIEDWIRQVLGPDRAAAFENGKELLEIVAECAGGLVRIKDLVREMGAFSRQADGGIKKLDIHALIDSVLRFTRPELQHYAQVHRTGPTVPPAAANEGHLRQVLLNVLINAAHAIPSRAQGSITVSTVQAANKVEICVADNGAGIPAEVLSRVCDPFFTTKPVGVGTGLGLAVASQLMRKMNGDLTIASVEGEGTTVTLSVPVWQDERVLPPVPERKPGPALPTEQRKLRVLVVDDEEPVLRILERVLRRAHSVTSFQDATSALEWIARNPEPDVVVCDLMMPTLSGMGFYRLVQQSHPGLPQRFVFLTGGAVTDEAKEFLRDVGNPVSKKPLSIAEIMSLVDIATDKGGDELRT